MPQILCFMKSINGKKHRYEHAGFYLIHSAQGGRCMIYGRTVDWESRCIHYHTKEDIIAIKFACCNRYYPCYKCHAECEDHPVIRWENDAFSEKAIVCGVCRTEHTIHEYLKAGNCKTCGSQFNEGCRYHHHLYFAIQ